MIISIHAPAKGATVVTLFLLLSLNISIHAPAKGATSDVRIKSPDAVISIHAPAKGATDYLSGIFLRPSYFNPRSREGSDHYQRTILSLSLYFNPRSREGSDHSICEFFAIWLISIHAPAKGATESPAYNFVFVIVFQSTLPRRERLKLQGYRLTCQVFQSTLPRRERLISVTYNNIICNFNPRSREGSDENMTSKTASAIAISIHAPAKGATSRLLYHLLTF